MSAFGMLKSRTIVKIAGGAKMFEIRAIRISAISVREMLQW